MEEYNQHGFECVTRGTGDTDIALAYDVKGAMGKNHGVSAGMISGLMTVFLRLNKVIEAGCTVRNEIEEIVDAVNKGSDLQTWIDRWSGAYGAVDGLLDEVLMLLEGAGVDSSHFMVTSVSFVKKSLRMINTILMKLLASDEVPDLPEVEIDCLGAVVKNAAIYPLYATELPIFSLYIGPMPVMGVPVTISLHLLSQMTVELHTGKCDLKGSAFGKNFFALAPVVSAGVHAKIEVGVGLPMLSIGLGMEVVFLKLIVPVQLDLYLDDPQVGPKAVVQVNPIVEALSGRVYGYLEVGVKFERTLFEWDGYRYQFQGMCRAADKDAFYTCPPPPPQFLPGSQHVHPANPDLRPVVSKPAVKARFKSHRGFLPPAEHSMCTPCEFLGGYWTDEWRCPMVPTRFATLAGMPNLMYALNYWITKSSIHGNKLADIELVTVCNEKITYNTQLATAAQGCEHRKPGDVRTDAYDVLVNFVWKQRSGFTILKDTWVALRVQQHPDCAAKPSDFDGMFAFHARVVEGWVPDSFNSKPKNVPVDVTSLAKPDTVYTRDTLGSAWTAPIKQSKNLVPKADANQILHDLDNPSKEGPKTLCGYGGDPNPTGENMYCNAKDEARALLAQTRATLLPAEGEIVVHETRSLNTYVLP